MIATLLIALTQCAADTVEPRTGHALAYDVSRQRVMMFGGSTGAAMPQSLWEFDGARWRCVAPDGPPGRRDAMLAFDAARNRLILFGGRAGESMATMRYLRDTWEWDGARWSLVDTAGPAPRIHGAIAYDPARRAVRVYGGADRDSALTDSWEFVGGKWRPLALGAPAGGIGDALLPIDGSLGALVAVRDSAPECARLRRAVIVAFTGALPTEVGKRGPCFSPQAPATQAPGGVLLFASWNPGPIAETWTFDGNAWLRMDSAPPPRRGAQMAFDAARGRVVMFGGDDGHAILGDTWEWDGTRWSKVEAPQGYQSRLRDVAGFDVNTDSAYDESVRLRLAMTERVAREGSLLFGTPTAAITVLRRLRTDSQYVMTDADSILAAYRDGLARARQLSLAMFRDAPDASLVVQPIPRGEAARSAPASYSEAVGGREAAFNVNAYQPGGIARMNVALGIAHEAYPGHHLQRLYSRAPVPPNPWPPGTGAFIEGWGIYAEQLGDEMGLYDTAAARLGYLVHLFDVYIALQVDIGIHARGWTREQAVDTMMAVAGRARVQAESYANRHVATPGQLASYAIGYRAIASARESAERARGGRFNLQEFHRAVIGPGPQTLAGMQARVAAATSP